MENFDIWGSLGLRDNPYNSQPVPSDELGEKLLVGRNKELRGLSLSLLSFNVHPTLEGGNGVGKTSLISVAGFRLYRDYLNGKGRFVLPLLRNFQLTIGENTAEFKLKVLLQVVLTLIDKSEHIADQGIDIPERAILESWRRTLRLTDISLAEESDASESRGDSEAITISSAVDEIQTWLEANFATPDKGFFLCIIDNLELLETSGDARNLLEEMRDEILNIPGLKWVLCGARGIVRSVASTGRLAGFLGDPIEVLPVADDYIGELIQARLEAFRKNDLEKVNAPVEVDGFLKLYHIGNKNLRMAMKYCQDFTLWAFMQGVDFAGTESKIQLLENWLETQSQKILNDTIVGKRAWAVFDELARKGGALRPSDYPEYGFKSYQAMIPHLKKLSEANLIESIVDGVDARKKTMSLLPLGWIVHYSRSKNYPFSGDNFRAESAQH